jgi:hypothetical protein
LTLERWRGLHLSEILPKLAAYAKRDESYVPAKDMSSEKWNVRQNGEFVLIVTGNRFWDVHAQAGGGGAIDLAKHLWACNYRAAVRRLTEAGV